MKTLIAVAAGCLVGLTFSALSAFLQAPLLLPARVFGGRSGPQYANRAAP